jgi:hypothetical protein
MATFFYLTINQLFCQRVPITPYCTVVDFPVDCQILDTLCAVGNLSKHLQDGDPNNMEKGNFTVMPL